MAGCIASEPGIAPAKPSRSPHTRLATTTQPVMIGPVARSSAATPVTDFAINRCIYRIIVAPRSEEHTSELQSLMRISYAVFCLKKKKNQNKHNNKYNIQQK